MQAVHTRQVPIGEAQRGLSALVGSVRYGGSRVVLTSRGRPACALVPVADLARLQRTEPPSNTGGEQ